MGSKLNVLFPCHQWAWPRAKRGWEYLYLICLCFLSVFVQPLALLILLHHFKVCLSSARNCLSHTQKLGFVRLCVVDPYTASGSVPSLSLAGIKYHQRCRPKWIPLTFPSSRGNHTASPRSLCLNGWRKNNGCFLLGCQLTISPCPHPTTSPSVKPSNCKTYLLRGGPKDKDWGELLRSLIIKGTHLAGFTRVDLVGGCASQGKTRTIS